MYANTCSIGIGHIHLKYNLCKAQNHNYDFVHISPPNEIFTLNSSISLTFCIFTQPALGLCWMLTMTAPKKSIKKLLKDGFVQTLQEYSKTAFPHKLLYKPLTIFCKGVLKSLLISHLSWPFPHCPLYQLILPLHSTHLIPNKSSWCCSRGRKTRELKIEAKIKIHWMQGKGNCWQTLFFLS